MEQVTESLRAAFSEGARTARIRSPTGSGGTPAGILALASLTVGPRLLLCLPRWVERSKRIVGECGLSTGALGSGADVEVTDYWRGAALDAPTAALYGAVLVTEVFPEQRPFANDTAARFVNARVVEVTDMPSPYPGMLERVDVEIETGAK